MGENGNRLEVLTTDEPVGDAGATGVPAGSGHLHTMERPGTGAVNPTPMDPNAPLTADAGQPVGLTDEQVRQIRRGMVNRADMRSYAQRGTIRVHYDPDAAMGVPVHVNRDNERWLISLYLEELFNDFASGDAYDRLGEFFYHLPEGFKQGAVSTWESLKVAWDGWGAILRDPKQMQDLPSDVKDAFNQVNAQIKDLNAAALEKDGGKRFAEKVSHLTGNAMFQATLGKATQYAQKALVTRLVPKAAPATLGAAGTPPKPTIVWPKVGPRAVRPPAPLPGPLAPVPPPMIPTSQLAQLVTSAGVILRGARFTAPFRSLGTFVQRHCVGCGLAQIRTAMRDLGLGVISEEALIAKARQIGVFLSGGTTPQGLAALVNRIRGLEAVVLPAGTRTAELARLLARFPHYKIITGIKTAAGGNHWVRLQMLGNNIAIIGDSASGQSIVSTLAEFRQARFHWATVVVRVKP